MKSLLSIILSLCALCCAKSQTLFTQILYPVDGQVISLHTLPREGHYRDLELQIDLESSVLPAQDFLLIDGQAASSGLFGVSPFVMALPWFDPPLGTHTLQSEVQVLDPFGNYVRTFSTAITITIVK